MGATLVVAAQLAAAAAIVSAVYLATRYMLARTAHPVWASAACLGLLALLVLARQAADDSYDGAAVALGVLLLGAPLVAAMCERAWRSGSPPARRILIAVTVCVVAFVVIATAADLLGTRAERAREAAEVRRYDAAPTSADSALVRWMRRNPSPNRDQPH